MGDMADLIADYADMDEIHRIQYGSHNDYWEYFGDGYEPSNGKYLFFCSNRKKLCVFAQLLIKKHGFICCKVSRKNQNDYVLCVYWQDDSRKHEMKDLADNYPYLKYRWWKSNADTLAGKYSKEFNGNI